MTHRWGEPYKPKNYDAIFVSCAVCGVAVCASTADPYLNARVELEKKKAAAHECSTTPPARAETEET